MFTSIQYECFNAPLKGQDEETQSWWAGPNGVKNFYWDGRHAPAEHVCACNATAEGCVSDKVTCNCDEGAERWLSDAGVLTDAKVLPVMKVSLGGQLKSDWQNRRFQLGPLRCSGRKVIRLVNKPQSSGTKYKLATDYIC